VGGVGVDSKKGFVMAIKEFRMSGVLREMGVPPPPADWGNEDGFGV
jgi:hypothetical protein